MQPVTGFRIQCPPFAHQTIDGEVVIVNLQTGHYYSLRGVGADIWTLVESGAGVRAITAALAAQYDFAPGAIAAAAEQLLAELQREGMLSPQAAPEPIEPAASAPLVSLPLAAKSPFVPPVLEKFTDMHDLLVLDPIHEVDEAGWPNVKDAA